MKDLLLFTYKSLYMHIPPSLCNNAILVPSLVLSVLKLLRNLWST